VENWIKLHRKIEDSAVFHCPHLLKLWVWCLCKATYKTRAVPVRTGKGLTQKTLRPGQLIFGRHVAAQALNMKPTTVWQRLKRLERLGKVDIQPDTHFSVITICNWSLYQTVDMDDGQATSSVPDNQVTTTRQPSDTIQDSNTKRRVDSKERVAEIMASAKIPEEFSSPECVAALESWLEYKGEIRKQYKSNRSFQTIMTRLKNEGHTSASLVDAIEHSIAQGYAGIYESSKKGVNNGQRKDIQPSLDW
jgi:DNA-binding Lrp family transcriptional regulator